MSTPTSSSSRWGRNVADSPQQAALRTRYPTVWDLARAFCFEDLPAGTDLSDLPVYCPQSVAPRDTLSDYSYSSVRVVCGAYHDGLRLRSDAEITVRGFDDAAGWRLRTEHGGIVVTRPDGTEECFVYDAVDLCLVWYPRDYTLEDTKAIRELQSKLATIILAHETNPAVPCRVCKQRPGIQAVGLSVTAEPEPCGDCQRASFRAWQLSHGKAV